MLIKTVQKRDGTLVAYDKNKIRTAIQKANGQLDRIDQITDRDVDVLTDLAETGIRKNVRALRIFRKVSLRL